MILRCFQSYRKIWFARAFIELLSEVVDESLDSSGWALLSTVGAKTHIKKTDFNIKDLGLKKLSDLFRMLEIFGVKEEKEDDKIIRIYIRPKYAQ